MISVRSPPYKVYKRYKYLTWSSCLKGGTRKVGVGQLTQQKSGSLCLTSFICVAFTKGTSGPLSFIIATLSFHHGYDGPISLWKIFLSTETMLNWYTNCSHVEFVFLKICMYLYMWFEEGKSRGGFKFGRFMCLLFIRWFIK